MAEVRHGPSWVNLDCCNLISRFSGQIYRVIDRLAVTVIFAATNSCLAMQGDRPIFTQWTTSLLASTKWAMYMRVCSAKSKSEGL
jgi:hypothetical protein